MKAIDTVFQKLLDGKVQYVVPLYQRTYSWEKSQWEQIWGDLLDIYAMDEPRNHFIGSVVTQQAPTSPVDVPRHVLIDGQQRMTTLFILLSEIRRHAKMDIDRWGSLADEIQFTCLVNQYTDKIDERSKIMLSKRDRQPFAEVVDGKIASEPTRIEEARNFFDRMLNAGDIDEDAFDLRKLHRCIVNHLDMVNITLEPHDSPNRIFESLNNTGMPLSVSDLIRNYLLMLIPDFTKQEQVYTEYWLPMEQLFAKGSKDTADYFFWHYLIKDGERVRKGDTYQEMQGRIDTSNEMKSIETLQDFAKFARYYGQLAGLENQIDLPHAIIEQIDRINQWEVVVVYPFLMRAMDDAASGIITHDSLLEIMRMIESFLVRRIICDRSTTNMLRHIFARLSAQVSTDNIVENTKSFLMANNNWPDDDDFRSNFVQFPIYANQRQNRRRANMVLWSLERDFGHKETPEHTDDVWIEHIMPQELTAEWEAELGSEAAEIHQRLLHTIGNLTLSAYNRELSNKPFADKKPILAKSNFALNQSLSTYPTWNADSIGSRASDLADRAVKIWKR